MSSEHVSTSVENASLGDSPTLHEPVTPHALRAVAGFDGDASKKLHEVKISQEDYNLDLRSYSSMFNKAVVFGSLYGSTCAASFLSVIRAKCPSTRFSASIPLLACAALPCALSIGYICSTSFRCEREFRDREKEREQWELDNYPEGEKAEMVQLYMSRGLSRQDAETVTNIFAKKDELLVDVMMVDELGYSVVPIADGPTVLRNGAAPAAIANFVSFLLPLLPFAGRVGDCKKATTAGLLIVCAETAVTSALQTRLLQGAYADTQSYCRNLIRNFSWLAVVIGVTVGVAKTVNPSFTCINCAE